MERLSFASFINKSYEWLLKNEICIAQRVCEIGFIGNIAAFFYTSFDQQKLVQLKFVLNIYDPVYSAGTAIMGTFAFTGAMLIKSIASSNEVNHNQNLR